MPEKSVIPSDLPPAFIPPQGWEENYLTPETGRKVRFCTYFHRKSSQTVLILPGLTEFCEKYIEIARFFHEIGFNVAIMDWVYQGKSQKLPDTPHRRHADGFSLDMKEIAAVIGALSARLPEDNNFYLLAHSMGGHMALRYLLENDSRIKATSLSAPLTRILDLRGLDMFVIPVLEQLKAYHTSYVPGGRDWHEDARDHAKLDIFSHDPVRKKIHQQWLKADPALRVGNPTLGWLYHIIRSFRYVEENKQKIKAPVLVALAGKERLVSNSATRKLLPPGGHISYIDYPKAYHELLMETDDVRLDFLNRTAAFFEKHGK